MRLNKIVAILCLGAVVLGLPSCGGKDEIKPTKNVILMIPDGTSTSVLSVVRWYRQHTGTPAEEVALASDPYMCAYVRQYCSDAPVAASPAAITSFMTGYRVQASNLGIYPKPHEGEDLVKVNPDSTYQPLATVLEGAKILKGKATGLVVTVKASHATPAGTASHVVSRNDDYNIIRQMASNRIDVVFGGGTKYMTDDVRSILADNDIKYIEKDVPAFRALKDGKAWALFTDSQMDFDLDRDTTAEPSLCEMTRKAIELLSQNENGFFLMVEGSKVDYAAHSNDPLGIISEYEAFDKAVAAAMDFAKKDGNTTVIVVPDHGNCGMTIGDRHYDAYYAKGLDSAFLMLPHFKGTAYKLAGDIQKCPVSEIRGIFKERTGIDLTEEQEKTIAGMRGNVEGDYMKVAFSWNIMSVVTDIVNSHTHIGYVSGSHTSEDVFLAVYNPNNQYPVGCIEGTDLAAYMSKVAGLPMTLDELTSEIYVKDEVLLEGHEFIVEGEKKDKVLVIDGGKLRVPANRSYAFLEDGSNVELASVSIYVPKNGKFYLSKEILKYI